MFPTSRRPPTLPIVFVICLLLWTGSALAQDCLPESEPNDTPAAATSLGTLSCAVGDLASGDQDTFVWTVDEEASQLWWVLEIESIPGQLTVANLFRVTFADNGVDVTAADELFAFRTPDGRLRTSEPFLIAPGTYILGTSASGGEGGYVIRLAPAGELRRSRSGGDRLEEVESAFALYGALQEDRAWRWNVSGEDAARRWQLELQGPVGADLALELTGPDGNRVARGATDGGSVVLSSLGLSEGEHTVAIVGVDAGSPYTLAAVSVGLLTDGGEIEPNNRWEDANIVTFERPLTGGGTDVDLFVFEMTPDRADLPFDLLVDSDDDLAITLFDAQRNELQQRRGSSGALRDLVLAAGSYGLEVRASGERYELRFESSGGAPGEGFESEPNDVQRVATPLSDDLTARGDLAPQDRDVYRFSTVGEPQLWRVQVLGQGSITVTAFNGGGTEQQSLSGERRVRLDNLVLLSGEHYIEVRGDEGEYALRALPLGPAPAPEPLDPVAAEAELEAAPEPPVQEEETAVAPVGPPPPPGLLESEPNDDDSRAELLEMGRVRVGKLSGVREQDVYRFFLANDQYIRIEAVGPEGSSLFFDLTGAGRTNVLEPGGPALLERWLLAGDYFLTLRSAEPIEGFYQLRLSGLDLFVLPADFEPNDEIEQAVPLPADLVAAGTVGRGARRDFYALPVFGSETGIRIEAEIDDGARIDLFTDDGRRLERTETGGYLGMLPAGEATFLRVNGHGRYRLSFSFDTPPDPAALAPLGRSADTELSFAQERAQVTAYWHQGQQFETEVTLVNSSAERRSYTLEVASSHFTVAGRIADEIDLAPGERTTLPLMVEMPHDLRDDQPIRITVAARHTSGLATAVLTLEPTCAAPPVNPALLWSVPAPLLGGVNVAWNGFGATAFSDRTRNVGLFDGVTSPAGGGFGERDEVVTVELPGNEPILLAGTLLHPQAGRDRVERQLFDFEIEVSLDGENFLPVLASQLASARVEQGFVFDAPVPARFARLRFGSNLGGASGSWLGEWKLIAAEPAPLGEINLADPPIGGTVVWSDPLVHGTSQNAAILSEDATDAGSFDARAFDSATWVVGFHHNRAAQIARFEWVEQVDSRAEDRFEEVSIEASLASPVGPWRELGSWTLDRDAAGFAGFELDTPEWVRYLRFTVPKREGSDRFYPPETLRVFERPADSTYRSAVGEWGHYRRDAGFEQVSAEDDAPAQFEEGDNDTLATAHLLASGEAIEGSVLITEDIDWYRFTVAEGENLLEISFAGDPTIGYVYDLFDSGGEPIVYDLVEQGTGLVLRYFGEPGDYFLKIEEPKRSVIFSWDTSGSVAPYTPITYNSLARFARDLDPEREFVQLLAFDDPNPKWLLPYWSADPQRVQEAINTFDRKTDSSNAERALLTASRALEEREGTRAVLLMTDAESPGFQLTPELWRSLERSRARVFTFEISTSGSDYSQDLMQSWANADAGFYDYARNVSDFDIGFARASCHLRRPKRYRVEVTTTFREPPGPGALRILRGEGSAPPAVEVIFDASGSMGKLLPSGVSRIETAKQVLTDFVTNVLPDGAGFALRAYGHIAPSSCETRLDVKLGPLDRGEALAAIEAIEPKLLSQTPIAASLLAVAGDLSNAAGPTTVVLLTDGLESCDGDPEAAIAELRAAGIEVQLAIISLGLEDPEDVAVFEALAEAVGATYVDAQDLGTLEASISAALRPPFEVLDSAGEVVARGTVEGEPISLPGGVYTVRVLTNPVEVLREVRVPAETTIRLTLGVP